MRIFDKVKRYIVSALFYTHIHLLIRIFDDYIASNCTWPGNNQEPFLILSFCILWGKTVVSRASI